MTPITAPLATLLVAVMLSCGCFLASLYLPCVYTGDSGPPFYGWTLLLMGPFGIFDGVVAWYANPLLALILVLLLTERFRLAALCGVPCVLLALSTFAMREMAVTEQPRYEPVTGYGPGFFLWLASLAIPVACALLFLCRTRERAGGEGMQPSRQPPRMLGPVS